MHDYEACSCMHHLFALQVRYMHDLPISVDLVHQKVAVPACQNTCRGYEESSVLMVVSQAPSDSQQALQDVTSITSASVSQRNPWRHSPKPGCQHRPQPSSLVQAMNAQKRCSSFFKVARRIECTNVGGTAQNTMLGLETRFKGCYGTKDIVTCGCGLLTCYRKCRLHTLTRNRRIYAANVACEILKCHCERDRLCLGRWCLIARPIRHHEREKEVEEGEGTS